MTHLISAQRAILAQREGAYNTDPTPTGAANYIELYDVSMPSYETTNAERTPVRPEPGAITTIVGTGPYKLEGTAHLVGSGAAGTAPLLADLLLACGLVEDVTVATDVKYSPVPKFDGTEGSLAVYDNIDGVRHKGTGLRGNLQMEFAHESIPAAKFSFTGNRANPADADMPTVDVEDWKDPVHVNKTNTQFTLHGATPVMHSCSFDLGNVVAWKDHVNSAQQARITGRKIVGSVSIEAAALADKDWYATVRNHTLGDLLLVHGITAGLKVEVNAEDVQLLNPKPEDKDGIQVLTFDLHVTGPFWLRFF